MSNRIRGQFGITSGPWYATFPWQLNHHFYLENELFVRSAFFARCALVHDEDGESTRTGSEPRRVSVLELPADANGRRIGKCSARFDLVLVQQEVDRPHRLRPRRHTERFFFPSPVSRSSRTYSAKATRIALLAQDEAVREAFQLMNPAMATAARKRSTPRTAISGNTPGHDWATLHVKCIVVDDERSLITSANFTDRAQTRSIETGVLIEDRGFSEELAGHWRQLVSDSLVRKYLG